MESNMWKYNDELYHYGIPGMHWGIRRFQPYSVTGPRKSGKRGREIGLARRVRKGSGVAKTTVNRLAKGTAKSSTTVVKGTKKVLIGTAKKTKAAAKAFKEETKKTYESGKEKIDNFGDEKIINSGDPKLVYKKRNQLTTQQLNDAIKRIETEKKLKDLGKSKSRKYFERGEKVITDAIFDGGGKALKNAATDVTTYLVKEGFKNKKITIGGDKMADAIGKTQSKEISKDIIAKVKDMLDDGLTYEEIAKEVSDSNTYNSNIDWVNSNKGTADKSKESSKKKKKNKNKNKNK